MASDARPVTNLPVVTTLAPNDSIVVVSNTAANGGNVSLISVSSLFGNCQAFLTQQVDPANSSAMVISQGVVFFSNNFGYISIANNTLRRWAITSF